MQIEQIGKYRVLAKIGQGAMGDVYKGHDPTLNRDVAIKTITASLGAEDDIRKRFLREAQSAARLNHPNIITVYDYGEEQGKIFMAMELLEGRDLKDLIAQNKLGDLHQKLDLMEQMADGLAFAHAHDLIHRDVKPANIHVQPTGQVKILDFGLARFSSSEMTRTGMVMGTPHYMSPEQVRGEKVDARSDIFSLGAVFYEVLSGHKPFDGDSMHTVLYHVMQDDPQPLRKWVDVPPMLVELVERSLIKDPTRRIQRAVHLGDGVRAVRTALAEGREAEARLDSDGAGPESTIYEAPRPASAPSAKSPGPKRAVAGAVALDPARAPEAVLEKTGRPMTTLSGRSSTQVGRGREPQPRSLFPLYAGLAALGVVMLAGGAGWYLYHAAMARTATSSSAAPDAGQRQIDVLTETIVANQVQLARKKLDDKSYADALAQAERALKLSPENADAKKVLEEAQGHIKGLDEAAADTRAGLEAQDQNRASESLWKLLSADPNYAGAEELSAALDKVFKSRAEEARRLMDQSRVAAERANATSADAFSDALAEQKTGQGLFASGGFGRAARRFLMARDGFERARGVARR
jgi:predicted Ser/Thr protein kinase